MTGRAPARVGPVAAARAALEARSGGRPVAIVARADDAGDGGRLLVFGPDDTAGTLGDPALDRAAAALGADLLASADAAGSARAADAAPAAPAAPAAGGASSDGAPLYAEVHRPPARLFIVGAGHIALPLARVGALLGLPLVVLDDRESFATEARFPAAARVLRVDFADPFAAAMPGPHDHVVLVTRAHRYDFDCLRRLLDSDAPPRYIGMVGSRRRIRAAFRALLDAGVGRQRLASIHAPIGVDIGAETPEEIAIAIAAEIVAVRRGVEPGGTLRAKERVLDRWLAEG